MTVLSIPNRPFSTDLITGLMLPDGLFVTMLGRQNITVHLKNSGASPSGPAMVYIESVSHPGISVSAVTHSIGSLDPGAATTLAWTADFTACPAGIHRISVIVDRAGSKTRLIKKIFVLGLRLDPARGFVAETPEGIMTVKFGDLVKPRKRPCCGCDTEQAEPDSEPPRKDPAKGDCCTCRSEESKPVTSLASLAGQLRGHRTDFRFCAPFYLPKSVAYAWEPTPAYQGQYGDLPYEDPWWKVVLAVIAFLLIVAASIAEAVDGSGSVIAEVEDPPSSSGPVEDCCGVEASGGGTSYIAAGLVAAAAAVATAAGLSDDRDAFRIGQDKTPPGDDEWTVAEHFQAVFSYPEPVALGRPFTVRAGWTYQRATDTAMYSHGQADAHSNVHVISHYDVSAPEVAIRANPDKPWIIKAKFTAADGSSLRGEDLFVQAFLVGPNGEWHRAYLQDDGLWPDEHASDGTYCAHVDFRRIKARPGLWQYFVIAQDVNHAQPGMTPEDAARIIGGMVLTNQLTLSFTEDLCPIVPDGHVMVV